MEVTDWTFWHLEDEMESDGYKDVLSFLNNEANGDQIYMEMYNTVIEEIRKNDYHFTGSSHQECNNGVPVIDGEYLLQLSTRSWGELMAEAYPDEDYTNYDNHALEEGYPKDHYRYLKWAWTVPEGEEDKVKMPQIIGPWDDYDWCYECTGYGNDYSFSDDGELVNNCDNCPHNKSKGEMEYD